MAVKLKNIKTCNKCWALDGLGGDLYTKCCFNYKIRRHNKTCHDKDWYPTEPCPKPTTRDKYWEIARILDPTFPSNFQAGNQ